MKQHDGLATAGFVINGVDAEAESTGTFEEVQVAQPEAPIANKERAPQDVVEVEKPKFNEYVLRAQASKQQEQEEAAGIFYAPTIIGDKQASGNMDIVIPKVFDLSESEAAFDLRKSHAVYLPHLHVHDPAWGVPEELAGVREIRLQAPVRVVREFPSTAVAASKFRRYFNE